MSNMSKKHYEAIASMVGTAEQDASQVSMKAFKVVDALKVRLFQYFRDENPRFDQSKFNKACQEAFGERLIELEREYWKERENRLAEKLSELE